jgi:hypothetical protein
LRLPMRTSSRRLKADGMAVTALRDVINILGKVVLKRPVLRAISPVVSNP